MWVFLKTFLLQTASKVVLQWSYTTLYIYYISLLFIYMYLYIKKKKKNIYNVIRGRFNLDVELKFALLPTIDYKGLHLINSIEKTFHLFKKEKRAWWEYLTVCIYVLYIFCISNSPFFLFHSPRLLQHRWRLSCSSQQKRHLCSRS